MAEICIRQAFLSFAVEREMGMTSPTSGRNNQPARLGATWKSNSHERKGSTTGTSRRRIDRRKTIRSGKRRRDKDREIAALRPPRGLIIACAGGVKLRLDGLASGEKVRYSRT